jgi:hypothetical protein
LFCFVFLDISLHDFFASLPRLKLTTMVVVCSKPPCNSWILFDFLVAWVHKTCSTWH